MDKPGLADLIIAPLTLLERSKGWKRRGLVFLYLMIATTASVFVWRAVCLSRLPDSPEPFDVVKYARVEVPDADNAILAYREIFARFGDLSAKTYNVPSEKAWIVSDWSSADPEVRRWADDQRNALEAWVPTNDRTDSLLVQPGELRMGTLLEPLQSIRPYVRLALLEGSRLELAGDLAGAWRMYRAALRASRHVGRHGGTIPHLIGNSLLRLSRPRVEAWIDRPGMTPELLRRAIADVEACWAMTSPASEMVRAEYFSTRDTVNDTGIWVNLADSGPYSRMDWTNQINGVRWARRFLRREPERSARVLRLITAGYLAQCDRPRAARPKLLFADSMIYDHDARTPPVVRSISSESLESWWKDSVLNDLGPYSNLIQTYLDAEVSTFDQFRLRMAERAFVIEHGRPPKTYGEMLGSYLKALPEGIEPEDLVNPGAG
jgi:hypothetical protein